MVSRSGLDVIRVPFILRCDLPSGPNSSGGGSVSIRLCLSQGLILYATHL